MDPSFLDKIFDLNADGKGFDAMAILNASAFLAPGDIRIGIFTPLIPDRTRRKSAVRNLQRRSLVRAGSKENYFFISESTQAAHREFLTNAGMDLNILEIAISLMKALNTFGDYPHFLSVYNHAKTCHALLEKLDTLPASIVAVLHQCDKAEEALKFAKECEELLVKTFGMYHNAVLSLQIATGAPLIELNRADEAIKVCLDALQKASRKFEIIFVIGSIMILTEAIVKNSPLDPLGAEAFLRQTIFEGKSVFDSWNDWELEKWVHYAKVISRFGLRGRAISILSDVIDRRKLIFGPGDDKLWEVKLTIAECLSADSKLDRAWNLLCEIDIEREEENYGEMHESRLRIQYEIGMVTKKEGRLKKSMDIFKAIADKSKTASDEERHLTYLKSMYEIAQIYMLQQNYEKSFKHSSDLYEKFVETFGVIHWRCYECLLIKIESLLELNKTKQALSVLEELLEDFENYKGLEEDIKRCHSMIKFIKNIDLFRPPSGSLHSFAKEGNLDEILSLVTNGGDIEAKDSNGITPLQYASVFGRVEIAKALFKKGAKYPSILPSGISPHQRKEMDILLKTIKSFFDFVKEGNSEKVIELFSKEDWILGARDNQGCTALHWAALGDHRGILRLLLELGSDPTVVSDKGNSPLHIAASKGHVKVAEALLRAVGPDKAPSLLEGKTSKGGNTPLHAAAEKGHEGMVKTLLAHGAVYCPMNASYKTPEDLCREHQGCWNFLMLVNRLFMLVEMDDVESAGGYMMRKEEEGSVLAVSRARNEKNRTLLQVAMKRGLLESANELLKLLEYDA